MSTKMGCANGHGWVAWAAVGVCLGLWLLPGSARAASAEDNYAELCGKCHGEDGDGTGPAAAVLDKHPGNFTDCEAMKSRTHEFLVNIITGGGGAVGRSPQMPASGKRLVPEEIDALAKYVASNFCEDE